MDRGGQLDLSIVGGLLRCLSALHNTMTAGPLVEKDQATTKPNACRMQYDCEGVSGMVVALACDGCCELLWRAVSPIDLALPWRRKACEW